jgi:hypothetical protein
MSVDPPNAITANAMITPRIARTINISTSENPDDVVVLGTFMGVSKWVGDVAGGRS